MAVVLPNGCFFRGGAEQLVRRDLVEADLIEAIIQLPKDMFFGAGIPACWLVLNRDKPTARRNRVLLIDASDMFERAERKNTLRDCDIERIVAAYRSNNTEEGFSATATRDDIAARRYNLTVRRYVRADNGDDPELPSLDEALAALRAAREALSAAEADLDSTLGQLDHLGDPESE